MTLHPKRCGLCALSKQEQGYDDSLFCTFGGGMTLIARPIIWFIAIRGCASFDPGVKESVAKLEVRETVEMVRNKKEAQRIDSMIAKDFPEKKRISL